MSYLSFITPINIAIERTKFFDSDTYSPQFVYNWSEDKIEKYRQNARLAPLVTAVVEQDTSKIAKQAKDFFQVEIRRQDIAFAEKLVASIPNKLKVTADDYALLAREKLADLGIDYRVEIVDKHGFQGRPDHKAKLLRLSKYLNPEFYSAEGLVAHELVHIIRAVNGGYNHIPVQPNYLATDEGLASLVQDKLLVKPTSSSFQHALEYLSSIVARDGSFRDVFNFLKAHGCSDESAWLRGIRQKFGICDTSTAGSLMKSAMSFYHELLLRELTTDELMRLFVGKIPLTDLPNYLHYAGIVPVDKIKALLGD